MSNMSRTSSNVLSLKDLKQKWLELTKATLLETHDQPEIPAKLFDALEHSPSAETFKGYPEEHINNTRAALEIAYKTCILIGEEARTWVVSRGVGNQTADDFLNLLDTESGNNEKVYNSLLEAADTALRVWAEGAGSTMPGEGTNASDKTVEELNGMGLRISERV